MLDLTHFHFYSELNPLNRTLRIRSLPQAVTGQGSPP